jgi:hypothetical protein
VPDRSHDTALPESFRVGARDRDSKPHRASDKQRPRISYHCADLVTLRMAEAGRAARLGGVAAEVLNAVIDLLPSRWTRIRDDRVRLRQIVALCPSNPHQRSVGRALARLERLDVIHYSPAQGRGATATISVHERLLAGIEELHRDADDKVVVPFSRPHTSSLSRRDPPTPQSRTAADDTNQTRPTEVDVDPEDVRHVMAELPEIYGSLPKHLRWLLGAVIRTKLARGYRPEQILAILSAPLPKRGVDRPFKLAVWRLIINQPGPGPRLVPLQKAWDAADADRQRRQHVDTATTDYRRIEASTTAHQRAAMLAAMQELFGPDLDPRAAIVTAGRRARRQHPTHTPVEAIRIWLRAGDTSRTFAGRDERLLQGA